MTEQITVAEAAMAVLGEPRMIRRIAFKAKPAKLAVSEIEMDLIAQSPF